MKLGKILAAEQSYRDNLSSFTMRDSVIALIYYIAIMIAGYLEGVFKNRTGIYLDEIDGIVCMSIPAVLCLGRLSKIGISKKNLIRSVLVSLSLGIIVLMGICIIPNIMAHSHLLPAKSIAYNVFYYFFIIGFSEEISFRGFIQPRLLPLCKKEWIAILVGGILFVAAHYPYQMASRGMTFIEYWPQFISSAPIQFMWHYVFTWLYRRYGNIFGSTVLHGCIDMSMGIF